MKLLRREFDVYEGYDNEYDDELYQYEDDDDNEYSETNYDDCSTMPIPTYDEKNKLDYVKLMQDYHSSDEEAKCRAIEAIIGDLTGLIIYIVEKKYYNFSKKYYEDLVQCGEIGVLVGLKDYDPKKSKPSTYFYYHIVHEIQDFINSNVYRTTQYYSANVKKVNRTINEFENAGFNQYSAKDISIQTGMSLDTVETALHIIKGKTEVSMEYCGEYMRAPEMADPAVQYAKKEDTDLLYQVLRECLTPEEALVVCYLHGLDDLEQLSLKAIAKKMNITIDRVKKLKITAFCKLKNSPLYSLESRKNKRDTYELEDEDSVVLFPRMQAKNSALEILDMEIAF